MFHTEVVIMATVTMPHLTGADIAHNSHIGKAMLSVQCAIPYDDIYQYIIWREIFQYNAIWCEILIRKRQITHNCSIVISRDFLLKLSWQTGSPICCDVWIPSIRFFGLAHTRFIALITALNIMWIVHVLEPYFLPGMRCEFRLLNHQCIDLDEFHQSECILTNVIVSIRDFT